MKITPLNHPDVHLDTYAFCNARCVFCGYPHMTRKKGKMSRELFHHIIEDISSWDKPTREIVPVHYGEFFLNPDWLYILQYIQDHLPNTKIAIPTNGSLLDDNKIDELVKIKNVYWLNFSVYGYFSETYERLIGLGADTIKKVEHAVVKIHKLRPDICIQVCTTNHPSFIAEHEVELFKKKWKAFATTHVLIGNLRLNKKFMKNYPSAIPCLNIFLSTIILWDGKVCLCCYDPNGELIAGDVKKNKILDIWNGELIEKYRKLHMEGERDKIPLCRSCTFTLPFSMFRRG